MRRTGDIKVGDPVTLGNDVTHLVEHVASDFFEVACAIGLYMTRNYHAAEVAVDCLSCLAERPPRAPA